MATVKVERLGIKMREGRLRWCGHVMKRDQEYVGIKMMEMELPGKRVTKEKISRCSERRYGRSWCEGDGRQKQEGLEKDDTLWLPLIEGKGRKKKKKKINDLPMASLFEILLFAEDAFLTVSDKKIKLYKKSVNYELSKIDRWLCTNELS